MVMQEEIRLQGTPICPGIAVGRPFLFLFSDNIVPEFTIDAADLEGEILRYRKALNKSREEIRKLQKQLELDGASEGISILDAHLQMMRDMTLTTQVEKQIRMAKKNAEFVFHKVIVDFEDKFALIVDEQIRERLQDIQDISRRILRNLRNSVRITLADIPVNSIVFAHDLVPSETAEAKKSRIGAFVTEVGGETSHAAIIARAKGIPYVSSIDIQKIENIKNSTVIIDGTKGEVILNPRASTLQEYQSLALMLNSEFDSLMNLGQLETETIDGYKVRLSANLEIVNEVGTLHQYGGDGVGLFRSEYICLAKDRFPSEEEQFLIYKEMVLAMKGLPLCIRTFDIGGDKTSEFLKLQGEQNPFLGCRAIRFMLKEKEAFKTQLQAILRASYFGPVSLMFPMISGIVELQQAKTLVDEAKGVLKKRGVPFEEKIKMGCMIEVPSAAITCDVLAKECDFLSIGTNDLVQYALAVDRGNQSMGYLYNPADPGVLRLMKMIVTECNRNGIPVSVCGEIAADPRFTPLLLGLGIHELSCALRYLPIVKNAIRRTSIVQAYQLAEEVLAMSSAQEIRDYLSKLHQKAFDPEGMLAL